MSNSSHIISISSVSDIIDTDINQNESISQTKFSDASILEYLRLGTDWRPLPSEDPLGFLQQNQHFKRLAPHLLSSFTVITTAKQRTIIPAIRNRRLNYTDSQPRELEFENARDTWPHLWQGQGQERRRIEERENRDEKAWVDSQFLGGEKQHVGKLGSLLGDYAEERAAERLRTSCRRPVEEFIPEEEDSDEDSDDANNDNMLDETPSEARANFERVIREHFIYGMLEGAKYDAVDWNDHWDSDNDRLAEERWFDDEDESM